MKTVSIQELKASLSEILREAAAGQRILVTRHHKPVASIVPPDREYVHVGAWVGRGGLRPLFQKPATGGRYLEVLMEDRRGRER